MRLLNGPVKLHLSHMKIIHGDLMGIQHVPNRTQGESGLLKPLAQLLETLGLRRTVHVTMCTHGINLKEDESVHRKGGPIKPPYLSTGTGRAIQGTLQVIQTNLNVGGRGRRHCIDRMRQKEGDGVKTNNIRKPVL